MAERERRSDSGAESTAIYASGRRMSRAARAIYAFVESNLCVRPAPEDDCDLGVIRVRELRTSRFRHAEDQELNE